MKLHCSKLSTTSRPIMMFIADKSLPVDIVDVDIMQGEHMQEPYSKMNPNKQVPVLEDGDFVLTECSSILKYLADKQDSPTYPKELQKRARVNEVMDWFNTGLYREYAYHLLYPQIFPHHKREPEDANKVTVEWGKSQCGHWLGVLNSHILGGKRYLCGNDLTIADYMGAAYIACGDLIRNDLSAYSNITTWMGTMRAIPAWGQVYDMIEGYAGSLKDQPFVSISP